MKSLFFVCITFLSSLVCFGDVVTDYSCQNVLAVVSELPDSPIFSLNSVNRLLDAYEPFDYLKNPLAFGIEVEGYSDDLPGYSDLIDSIKFEISNESPDAEVLTLGDTVVFYKNNYKYIYSIEHEALKGLDIDKRSFELVSPIMRDDEDLNLFYKILRSFRFWERVKPYPSAGGVHVHVGFPDPRVEELALLLLIMFFIEDDLYDFFSTAPKRLGFAQKMSDDHVDNFKDKRSNYLEMLFRALSFDEIKEELLRKGLNLDSLNKHGTVEFRMFNSTFNTKRIDLMKDFSVKLVKAVRSKDPRLIKLLIKSLKNKKPLDFYELAKALDMNLSLHFRVFNTFKRQLFFDDLFMKLGPKLKSFMISE